MLYLGAHDITTLPNDFQVLFALSRISDNGNAGVWKENWLASVNAAQNCAQNLQNGYGTLQQLFTDIMAAFTTTTSVQEALRKLKSLKMGATSADEHTAIYELLVNKAELATAGDAILIDFYRSSLAPWLIERIYQGDVPNTLQEWKERAILLDYNKCLAAAFTGGGHSGGHAKGKKKKFNFRQYPQASTSKDPDTMDVDRLAVEIQCLSYEEQKVLMEKGLFFGCKKPGHFIYNCPDKKKKNPPKVCNGYKGKVKPKACATFTQIHALVNELSDGEMAEFQDLADKEGLIADDDEGGPEEDDMDF